MFIALTRFAGGLVCASACVLTPRAIADTAFSYQGELKDTGAPANGSYDFEFFLYDAASGGFFHGGSLLHNAVPVVDGRFTVELDFGAESFDNSDRWLEIWVNGVTLTPRQPITRAPYAIQTRGIFVDDSNNVGIGTTAPSFPLHIQAAQPYTRYDDTGGGSSWVVGVQGPTVGFNVQELGVGARFVINDGGNVGIGTHTPQTKLHVAGSAAFDGWVGIGTTSPANPFDVVTGDDFTTAVKGQSNATNGGMGGYFECNSTNGIGVQGFATATTGTAKGVMGASNSVNGSDFFAAGAGIDYDSSSSRRWKRNITNIDSPLAKVAQLRGVYFDWDEEHGGRHDIGFIAEEVGEVLPEIVSFEENGVDATGLDYSRMTPLLVQAVNELHAEKDAEIAELSASIAHLTQLNESLQNQLFELSQTVEQLRSTASEKD